MNFFPYRYSLASVNSDTPVVRSWRPLFWFPWALLLLVLQLASGTKPIYSFLVFALLGVSYYAVTWAGGLKSLFGVAILYLLLQHVLISQIAKVFFWEAADAPLRRPVETMGVYLIGMSSLALGVRLANQFRWRRRPLFAAETKPSRLLWMSIFCTIFSTALFLAVHTVGTDSQTGGLIQGGVLGPLKQLGLLSPLAVASGTVYSIRSSAGRHSFGLVNATPIIVGIIAGVIGAMRETVAAPVVIYVLTCIAFGYRFRLKHYGLLLVAVYLANFVIFPYALIARGFVRTGNFETNVSRSLTMMIEIVENPFIYRDQVARVDAKQSRLTHQFDYYNHPSSTLSRYTLLPITDGLVDATFILGTTEMQTITPGFEAVLPRFLDPDKPFVQAGNQLAHRVPGLSPGKNDYTTGITTGFFADAFTSYAWLGICLIPCIIILCLMIVYRFLIDECVWKNVLALSLLEPISWGFSEGTIANMILLSTVGVLATWVGLAGLNVLVFAFDKVTDRLHHARIIIHDPHAQALQRVLTHKRDAASLK